MTLLKLHLRVILIVILFSAISFAGQYKVTGVVDGDTIKVSRDGTTNTVRLVGIDAPETSKRKNEPGHPFSRKSTKHLASLVLNKSVMVKSYGTDRYGRTLGVVFVGDLNVNLEMVKVGLALNQMSGTDPIIVSTTYGGLRAPFDIYKRDCSQAHGLSRFHIVGGKSF